MAAKQFMLRKTKVNFTWEIFVDFIGNKARGLAGILDIGYLDKGYRI